MPLLLIVVDWRSSNSLIFTVCQVQIAFGNLLQPVAGHLAPVVDLVRLDDSDVILVLLLLFLPAFALLLLLLLPYHEFCLELFLLLIIRQQLFLIYFFAILQNFKLSMLG